MTEKIKRKKQAISFLEDPRYMRRSGIERDAYLDGFRRAVWLFSVWRDSQELIGARHTMKSALERLEREREAVEEMEIKNREKRLNSRGEPL